MEIDFFCFSVPSLNSTDHNINPNDNENTIWIKTKDMELMEEAKANDMLIVFDRSTKKFYNNSEEFDIRNKVIFPRSHIPYEEELTTYISKNGGISIQTIEDHEKIINWPNFIQPIHRAVVTTTYEKFKENNEIYKSMFKKLFIKTATKSNIHTILDFYGNIKVDDKEMFFTKPPLFNISSNDTVFLSESFESIDDPENDMDCKEYRVYVLNNELLSISRSYVDYPTIVPEEVKTFVEEQIARASLISDFPNSYVLDVGQIKYSNKEVIDIIEYNPICSSGLEVCNKLVEEMLNIKNQSKKLIKK